MFESPPMSEAEVLLASRGDREAFARLVAATRSLVAAIALVELRDVEAARDVAQDVYLQVWDDLHELRNPASFLPFLRQVTRLRARRVAERRAREVRGPAAEELLAGAVDPALDPGSRLLRAEQAAVVRDALDALPQDARETIALYYLEGHSASQVARLLGLSDQAVYQRLSRARGLLRVDVLARLGETLEAAAPGSAFTAGVLAALPSNASAQVAAAGMAAAATGVAGKATVGGGVVVALVALVVAGSLSSGGRTPGHGDGGGSSIARPVQPVTRDDRTLEPEAGIVAVESGLDVRVTARGAPVADAEVKLYRRMALDAATGRPAWQVTRTARTGADGRVRLEAGAGPWLVTSRAPGLAPGQVELIRPTGPAFTNVDVELHAPSALSGRVVARPSGDGVPLATLWLERESSFGTTLSHLPLEERFGATSSPRGHFTVGELSPGRYRLVVEAPGHARTAIREVVVPRTAPLIVQLGAAGVIEGAVRLADGSPAIGAEVTFIGGPEVLTVTSGSGGGYSAEVNPGSFRVLAGLGGATGAYPHAVPVAAGASARADVHLGTAAVIAGRVTDDGGAPIAGAQAVLTPAGTVGEMGRALSRPDGTFELGPLGSGEYDLDVVADGHSPDSRRGLVVLPGQRFEIDFRLDGVGVVEGVVRDRDGAPVEGARVSGGTMWGGAAGSVAAEAVTGADGHYVLPGLEVGVARIRAHRPGWATRDARTVTVRVGKRSTADFVLVATGILEGEVRYVDGRPAEAGLPVLVAPDMEVVRLNDAPRVEVVEGGRYRVELPAGDFKAYAGKAGRPGGNTWAKVKVAGGETARLDLVAGYPEDAPNTLAIEVREPGGAPAGDAVVTLESPGYMWVSTADEEGRTAVSGRPGAVRVTARKGGRVSLPVEVAEASREVVVDLRPAASVKGRLLAPGAPRVNGFALAVETPGASEGQLGRSDRRHFSGDRFELSELPPGLVRLVATAPDGRAGEILLSVSPGESVERDIALHVAGVIQVRPVGADGQPVDGVYAILGSRMVGADGQPVDAPDAILGSGTGDIAFHGILYPGDGAPGGGAPDRHGVAPGMVVVEQVPPGRQSVRVGARQHKEIVKEVDISPGQLVDLGVVRLLPVSR
jgi:RNA polymerase sigma factor (sigma-70 family)